MTTIFVCYDCNQKKFLEAHGVKDILYGLHPKTLKMFWIYERNTYFNKILKEWKDTKPSALF